MRSRYFLAVICLSLCIFSAAAWSLHQVATVFDAQGRAVGSGVVVKSKKKCLLFTSAHVSNKPAISYRVGMVDDLKWADLKWDGFSSGSQIDVSIYQKRGENCEAENIPNILKIRNSIEYPIAYLVLRSASGRNVYRQLVLPDIKNDSLYYLSSGGEAILEGASGSPVYAAGVLVGIYAGVEGGERHRVVRIDFAAKSDARILGLIGGTEMSASSSNDNVMGRLYGVRCQFNTEPQKTYMVTSLELFDITYRILPPRSESKIYGEYLDALIGKVKEEVKLRIIDNKECKIDHSFDSDFDRARGDWVRVGLLEEFDAERGTAWGRSKAGIEFINKVEEMRLIDPRADYAELNALRERNAKLEKIASTVQSNDSSVVSRVPDKTEFMLKRGAALDLEVIPGQLVSLTSATSVRATGIIAGVVYDLETAQAKEFSLDGVNYKLILLESDPFRSTAKFRLIRISR